MRFLLPLLVLGIACGPNPAIDEPCAIDPCGTVCRARLSYCNQPEADGGPRACRQGFDWCQADGGADAGR